MYPTGMDEVINPLTLTKHTASNANFVFDLRDVFSGT